MLGHPGIPNLLQWVTVMALSGDDSNPLFSLPAGHGYAGCHNVQAILLTWRHVRVKSSFRYASPDVGLIFSPSQWLSVCRSYLLHMARHIIPNSR